MSRDYRLKMQAGTALLAAAAGSFALTGNAMSPRRARTMPAAQGGFALSGQAISAQRRFYTSFPTIASPVSEGGRWVKNDTTRTQMIVGAAGRCYGTQLGSGGFDDSCSHLSDVWAPNIQITATLFVGTCTGIQEVELMARMADTSSTTRGYEVNFAWDGSYVNFYRWEGTTAGADFVPLVTPQTYSVSGGFSTGHQIRITMIGDTLNAYYNKGSGWVLINTGGGVSDTSTGGHAKWSTGTPGIGAYRELASGAGSQFALEDFEAIQL